MKYTIKNLHTSLRHTNLRRAFICTMIIISVDSVASTKNSLPQAKTSQTSFTTMATNAAKNTKNAALSIGQAAYNLPGQAVGLVATGGKSAEPVKFITGPTNSLASLTGYKPNANITKEGWNFTSVAENIYNAPGQFATKYLGSTAPQGKFITGSNGSLTSATLSLGNTIAQATGYGGQKNIAITPTTLNDILDSPLDKTQTVQAQTSSKSAQPRLNAKQNLALPGTTTPLLPTQQSQLKIQEDAYLTMGGGKKPQATQSADQSIAFTLDPSQTFITADNNVASFVKPQAMGRNQQINNQQGRFAAAQESVVTQLAKYTGSDSSLLSQSQKNDITSIVNTQIQQGENVAKPNPIVTAGLVSAHVGNYLQSQQNIRFQPRAAM